jgi:hypothetical protein
LNNPLPADDGDIIRGLGFVTLHSAYLEEEIDAWFDTVRKIPDSSLSLTELRAERAGEKIKLCLKVVKARKHEDEAGPLLSVLHEAEHLLSLRHEYVHGRIYSDSVYPHENSEDTLDVPATRRREKIERKVTSAELYNLANRICNLMPELRIKKWLFVHELDK